nr:MAG TPA: hypothetical protein [Inoviridae sp.]
MCEIIGVQPKHFTSSDGVLIQGWNVWYTEPRKGVDGVVADRVFVSDRVSNASSFIPHVGDTVLSFSYNKFGKLSLIIVE